MSLRDYFSNNKIFTGTEKPTQGKFDVGDIIVNIGPNSAEEPMWICVEAGTPGVWELCSGVNEEEIADIVQANALSAIDYTDGVDIQIDGGEIGNMNELQTTDKSSIVGAINELFQSANNGKELIANAIGEPVSSEDTFQAMSNDINSLLSTFKTNMMNSGVMVESSDKFKSLIDKIKGLTEGEGNKGIQFAEGTFSKLNDLTTEKTVTYDLDFTPTMLFVVFNSITNNSAGIVYKFCISNIDTISLPAPGYSDAARAVKISLTNITNESFTILDSSYYTTKDTGGGKWYAIGVGEEDTTLRDSLASILQEEGVSITEEDDMASLIGKVEQELENKEKRLLYTVKNATEVPIEYNDNDIYIISQQNAGNILTEFTGLSNLSNGDILLKNLNCSYTLSQNYNNILSQDSQIIKKVNFDNVLQYNNNGFSSNVSVYYSPTNELTKINKDGIIYSNDTNIINGLTFSGNTGYVHSYSLTPYANLSFTSTSASKTSYYGVYLSKQVDLTNYSKLVVCYEFTSPVYVNSGNYYGPCIVIGNDIKVQGSQPLGEYVYDISSYKGTQTIYLYCATRAQGTARLKVYYAYLV